MLLLIISLATLTMEKDEELRTVQSAVIVTLVENNFRVLPSLARQLTADISAFPDCDTPPEYKGLGWTGNCGYVHKGQAWSGPAGPWPAQLPLDSPNRLDIQCGF